MRLGRPRLVVCVAAALVLVPAAHMLSVQPRRSAADAVRSAATPTLQVPSMSGHTYYVDCSGGADGNAGTHPVQAWSSLARANRAHLTPGDSLLFKRGCSWAGPLNASWTGTPNALISVGAYGEGPLPRINGSARIMLNVSGSYLVVESLALSATPDHIDPGCNNQTVGDRKGVFFRSAAQHNRLQHMDLTSLSVGVDIGVGANYNSIENNIFHDVNMMFTLTPQDVNNNDDAGAQVILIEGDYNDIGYNTFIGTSACMYDYLGVAGTSVVLYGGNHNSIHHNYAKSSGANFAEIGASIGARRVAQDNVIAYNVSVGSQFVTVHGRGDQWGPTSQTQLVNNVSYTAGAGSISCTGCGPDVLMMRNNIIWADKSATLYVDAPIDEAHNIFWSRRGDAYNSVPISPTSRVVDPQFRDPEAEDFHLRPTSPAVHAGTRAGANLDFSFDLDGSPVPPTGPLNIGAYAR